MTITKNAVSLAGAAALFALTATALAAAPPQGSSGIAVAASDKVHCYGVNECKGTAACKTADHACKGQNSCKGQGFTGSTAGECLGKNGIIGDLSSK
jgi:uncharacterized membrane protein